MVSVNSVSVNYGFCQLCFCQLRILSTLFLSTLFCQLGFCQTQRSAGSSSTYCYHPVSLFWSRFCTFDTLLQLGCPCFASEQLLNRLAEKKIMYLYCCCYFIQQILFFCNALWYGGVRIFMVLSWASRVHPIYCNLFLPSDCDLLFRILCLIS